MPYVIRKVRKQDCYKVSNKKTKKNILVYISPITVKFKFKNIF